MSEFIDHYMILQVQHFAEKEVIQAAYKKLCYKYHPDRNQKPNAEETIKDLNLAYNILKDDDLRRVYDKEWRKKNNKPAILKSAQNQTRNSRSVQTEAIRNIVDQYFTYIIKKDFKKAYSLLCETDKKNIPFSHFKKWRRSIRDQYHISSFQVVSSYAIENFKGSGESKCKAESVRLIINEKNLETSEICQYSFDRTIVYENNAWYIHLGYKNVLTLSEEINQKAG